MKLKRTLFLSNQLPLFESCPHSLDHLANPSRSTFYLVSGSHQKFQHMNGAIKEHKSKAFVYYILDTLSLIPPVRCILMILTNVLKIYNLGQITEHHFGIWYLLWTYCFFCPPNMWNYEMEYKAKHVIHYTCAMCIRGQVWGCGHCQILICPIFQVDGYADGKTDETLVTELSCSLSHKVITQKISPQY